MNQGTEFIHGACAKYTQQSVHFFWDTVYSVFRQVLTSTQLELRPPVMLNFCLKCPAVVRDEHGDYYGYQTDPVQSIRNQSILTSVIISEYMGKIGFNIPPVNTE